MNRTIKEGVVRGFPAKAGQLRTHLADFMAACNCADRLKALGRLARDEYIATDLDVRARRGATSISESACAA